jgi:pilus assembly protein CpaB
VDDVTGVSGFITPNSRVDVLVSGSDGDDREHRSKLILQNVKVLATGKSIEQKDEKPVEVPTVTLLVSPADAEKLTLAARQDPVRLALRNYRDEDFVGTPGITISALLGHEAPAPVAMPAKMPVKAPVHRPAPYAVEVFLGSKLFRQEFEPMGAPAEPRKRAHDEQETAPAA